MKRSSSVILYFKPDLRTLFQTRGMTCIQRIDLPDLPFKRSVCHTPDYSSTGKMSFQEQKVKHSPQTPARGCTKMMKKIYMYIIVTVYSTFGASMKLIRCA